MNTEILLSVQITPANREMICQFHLQQQDRGYSRRVGKISSEDERNNEG
jgi:hypothetical protein